LQQKSHRVDLASATKRVHHRVAETTSDKSRLFDPSDYEDAQLARSKQSPYTKETDDRRSVRGVDQVEDGPIELEDQVHERKEKEEA
jgi:hypothetical protein